MFLLFFQVIRNELYRNLGLAFLCVFLMTLFLIANLWTCILVGLCVIMTLVSIRHLIWNAPELLWVVFIVDCRFPIYSSPKSSWSFIFFFPRRPNSFQPLVKIARLFYRWMWWGQHISGIRQLTLCWPYNLSSASVWPSTTRPTLAIASWQSLEIETVNLYNSYFPKQLKFTFKDHTLIRFAWFNLSDQFSTFNLKPYWDVYFLDNVATWFIFAERMVRTMYSMGPAVFYGGFSTFLAFILLAASKSYIFKTFFKVSAFTTRGRLLILPKIVNISKFTTRY